MEKDLHQLLQEYIDGTMPDNERNAFKTRIESDADLKRDYELLKDMEKELGDKDVENFRTMLGDVMQTDPTKTHDQIEKSISKRIVFSKTLVAIAASLLLLITFAWWQFNPENDLTKLGDDNFIAFETPIPRGQNDEINKDKEFFRLYDLKRFGEATNLIEESKSLSSEDSEKDEVKLYAAISYLAIDEIEKAIAVLKSIKPTPSLLNKVAYSEGIAYLKKSDSVNARLAFKKINPSDNYLYTKAQQILSQLE